MAVSPARAARFQEKHRHRFVMSGVLMGIWRLRGLADDFHGSPWGPYSVAVFLTRALASAIGMFIS